MTKKTGSNAKVTGDLLIRAAKKEFAEKGYDKASLRSICKEAGVTTGALYNLFESKEKLFNAVVDQLSAPLLYTIREHCKREQEAEELFSLESVEDDTATLRQILALYYADPASFRIILQENRHPRVQAFFDELTDILDDQIRILCVRTQVEEKSPFFVHWLSHLIIDTVLQMIAHHNTYEEAVESAGDVVEFMRGGTSAFLQRRG